MFHFQIKSKVFLLSVLALFLASAPQAKERKLLWEDLIPPSGQGQSMATNQGEKMRGIVSIEEHGGEQEDYDLYLEALDMVRYQQPQGAKVRVDLDGQQVRIPGYITPLGFDYENLTEFLLVPYHGACIHVPPPPGNQIVYVSDARNLTLDHLFDPVWVVGTLKVNPVSTALADAGYRMEGARVELYESE